MTPTQALEALAERMGIADNYRVTVTPRVTDYSRPIYRTEKKYAVCICDPYYVRLRCYCYSGWRERSVLAGYETKDAEPYVTFDANKLIADLNTVQNQADVSDALTRLTPLKKGAKK